MKPKLSRNHASPLSSFSLPQKALGPFPSLTVQVLTASANVFDDAVNYHLTLIEQFSSPLKPAADETNGKRKEVILGRGVRSWLLLQQIYEKRRLDENIGMDGD
jgi:hypothetical protein